MKNFLDKIILEYLTFGPPELDEAESNATIQAKAMGLEFKGGGNYGPPWPAKATHKSVDGGARLVPIAEKPDTKQKAATKITKVDKTVSRDTEPNKKTVSNVDKKKAAAIYGRAKQAIERNVTRANGPQIAARFYNDLERAMKDTLAGKNVDDFIEKWGLHWSKNVVDGQTSILLYSNAITPNGNKLGNRKPFGKRGTSAQEMFQFFQDHGVKIPSLGAISNRFLPSPELFPNNVFADMESDLPVDKLVRDDGTLDKIKIGPVTLSYNDPKKYKGKPEPLIQIVDAFNAQLNIMESRLWNDKTGEFEGFVIAGEDASEKVATRLIDSLHKVEGIREGRVSSISRKLAEMAQLSGPNADEMFKEGLIEVLSEINSVNDGIRASSSRIAESLSVLGATLNGKIVVVPTASNFEVGDLITFNPRDNSGDVVEVTMDNFDNVFKSVKYRSGAASAQASKIDLTAYKGSNYGSANEIKNTLKSLTSLEMRDALFSDDPATFQKTKQQIDELWEKYSPLISEYVGSRAGASIRRTAQNGKTPRVLKNGKLASSVPTGILKGNSKWGRQCAEYADRWRALNEMGFLVDVINNTHMIRQTFTLQNFSAVDGVKESTGGFKRNGKQSVATSKYIPQDRGSKCKPERGMMAASTTTDMSDLTRV